MKNLKIGKKLILGYAVILIFSLTTSIVAIIEINKIWKDTRMLYEGPFLVSNYVRDIKIRALNIRRQTLDMVLVYNKDKGNLEEFIQLIDMEENAILRDYNKILQIFPDQSEEINVSLEIFRQWKPLRNDVIENLKKGDTVVSAELLSERNRHYVDKLFQKLQEIVDESSERAEELFSSAAKTKRDIILLMVAILFLSLTASILFAYLITRSIVPGLHKVVISIGDIARGNLSGASLSESNDEIGQLAASFNKMQENLREKSRVAGLIAQGDFSTTIIPAGPQDILAESVNRIARNFDLVVKQAQRVAAGDYETEFAGIGKNPLGAVINQMLSSLKEVVAQARQVANGDYSGEIIPKSKADELAQALNAMTAALRVATEENKRQNILKTAQNDLNEKMRGDLTVQEMTRNIITFISRFAGAQLGAIYILREETSDYCMSASYAFQIRKDIKSIYKEGEGLIGQAAAGKEIIRCDNLPENYVKISSALGESVPKQVVIAPFVYSNRTIGVIEIGAVNGFDSILFDFLERVLENIAISVASAQNRTQMMYLLDITSKQAQELQVQQEELKQTNEELESQTLSLKRSEEYLQAQQEELRQINEELEEKTRNLEKQKSRMEEQNIALEAAWNEVRMKARELEITNKYKSEFLANMSHELRTPLNSLLILSQTLSENREGNLTAQQVESSRIIYNSGQDLLNLINDILDLSKIESGKMSIVPETAPINEITEAVKSCFLPMIIEKQLNFDIVIAENTPEKIVTDSQRLNQILRNLMSNAIKFTEKGSITFSVFRPSEKKLLNEWGMIPQETVAFSVKDTGIGIPADRQNEIFEAFQQLDGSISRKYGGTGLGLSITKELTHLLGGRVKLTSEPGKGSEFVIYLPENLNRHYPADSYPKTEAYDKAIRYESKKETPSQRKFFTDDRDKIKKTDAAILIIEDDETFALMLANICREKGFSVLATPMGEEGIELARKFRPKGILLDINLPGMNGWDVLEALKSNTVTRHIPVHIVTVYNETMDAYNKGAMGFLSKPVTKENLENAITNMQEFISREIKDLLIVEDDDNLRKAMRMLLESKDIHITECSNGKQAAGLITSNRYDCIVLDLGLPDMTGFELLNNLKDQQIKIPPIVVYTGKEITQEENEQLQQYTHNIIIKGVKSEERLLDETALFLHRVVDDLPDRQKNMLIHIYDKDQIFRDKKILLVDDDMRNVFALTKVLEASQMKVFMAGNGQKALEILDQHPEIDLVLMDIMMPVMNGYEAMRKIRANKRFEKLPVIALTAKAMKEDREKSLAAGANDYLSKPVDTQKLFNMMRIWLYK